MIPPSQCLTFALTLSITAWHLLRLVKFVSLFTVTSWVIVFHDNGKHPVIFFDDLSKQAVTSALPKVVRSSSLAALIVVPILFESLE